MLDTMCAAVGCFLGCTAIPSGESLRTGITILLPAVLFNIGEQRIIWQVMSTSNCFVAHNFRWVVPPKKCREEALSQKIREFAGGTRLRLVGKSNILIEIVILSRESLTRGHSITLVQFSCARSTSPRQHRDSSGIVASHKSARPVPFSNVQHLLALSCGNQMRWMR